MNGDILRTGRVACCVQCPSSSRTVFVFWLYEVNSVSPLFLFASHRFDIRKPKHPLISLKNGVLYKGPCFTGSMLCLLLLRMRGVFISVPFEPKPISTMVRLLENASALFDKGNCVSFFWPRSSCGDVDGTPNITDGSVWHHKTWLL